MLVTDSCPALHIRMCVSISQVQYMSGEIDKDEIADMTAPNPNIGI